MGKFQFVLRRLITLVNLLHMDWEMIGILENREISGNQS